MTASSCGHGPGLHLSDDLTIVEPVDRQGRPVAPGERAAKIYATVLYNHTLPLIRYEISDEITLLDEACPCGSAHRLISDPLGRLDDAFYYDVLMVHPHMFRSALARRREVIEYQVGQTTTGAHVVVRCQALSTWRVCGTRSGTGSRASACPLPWCRSGPPPTSSVK